MVFVLVSWNSLTLLSCENKEEIMVEVCLELGIYDKLFNLRDRKIIRKPLQRNFKWEEQ